MTNTHPTPRITPSESSPDHSPSDRDFFNRLLFLESESNSKKTSLANANDNPDQEAHRTANTIPYDQKLSNGPTAVHVSNSNPTIHPTNALRLHLNEPSAPLRTPHDPVRPPSNTPNNDIRPNRVRFRSRVRITSGFSHHRQQSVGSSRSGSPSSSISAPLRSHSDDSTNAWGTLGQRVGLLALQRKVLGSPKAQRRQKKKIVPAENVDERTPLRNSYNDLPYVPGEEVQEGDIPGEDSDDDRLSREVDVVFGKFPGRLLNHHWWYWQLESIICCHYAADFD